MSPENVECFILCNSLFHILAINYFYLPTFILFSISLSLPPNLSLFFFYFPPFSYVAVFISTFIFPYSSLSLPPSFFSFLLIIICVSISTFIIFPYSPLTLPPPSPRPPPLFKCMCFIAKKFPLLVDLYFSNLKRRKTL